MNVERSVKRFEVSLKLNNIIARLMILFEAGRASDLQTLLDDIDALIGHRVAQLTAIRGGMRKDS